MTEPEQQNHAHPAPPAKPPHAVYHYRDYSYIWLVPIITVIVVGWMAWSNWHKTGPDIRISFEKADGIDANRTQIRHKGVVLGIVTGLAPSPDFSHVVVTARMGSIADPYLTSGAQFWIVRPRVSVGAISDLNTLVSGSYIELAPGKGDHMENFVGREDPMTIDPQEPGKVFVLRSPSLGSLERGSPIYFHGLQVGEVMNFELAPDKSVAIHIFVHAPYDAQIFEQTRFWNASGIGISAGPTGIKVAAQSLQSIVQGGIVFDVPDTVDGGNSALNGASFPLYADRDTAFDSVYTKKIFYRLSFEGTVVGLDTGAAVNLLGKRVGHVVATGIDVDPASGAALPHVLIEIDPERIHFTGAGDESGDVVQEARDAFQLMVKRKLRAQLATGNLLTGQKSINLGFVEDAAPGFIAAGQPYDEFPTAPPDDLDSLLRDAHVVLSDADKTVRALAPQIQSIASSVKQTTDQINSDDASGGGLAGTLNELRQAAQSVRDLADYLDAHPESILRGKKEEK